MITYNLMKERVPDVGLSRCQAAIKELSAAFPPEGINPVVKCIAPCGYGGYSQYSMQKLACFDTMNREARQHSLSHRPSASRPSRLAVPCSQRRS